MSKTSPKPVFEQRDITSLANQILAMGPDPAPRYLILRDLLRCSTTDASLQDAERNLSESRWIKELAASQQEDGTWGRFHSQDSRVKSPFPTTEFAIRRGLALGLDKRSPVLQKAAAFIGAHLEGKTTWSDPPEKHDDHRVFPYNIRSVSAAMLALIDRYHPLLDPFWLRWAELVDVAFASGTYDAQAELARYQSLSGIPSRHLAAFHVYYPLLILASTRRRLPVDLERRMIAYLLHKPDGIYYVCSQSLDTFPRLGDKRFSSWLHGHTVLARFESWKEFAPVFLNWLWSLRSEAGLWDMGKDVNHSFILPLSETWRRMDNRIIDCSVTILCLLQRYFD